MSYAARSIADPITIPYASTITPNAAEGALYECTATGDLTLADPTGGVDGQEIRVKVTASGGTRTLTFSGGAGSVSIPSGETWIGNLLFDGSTWLLSDGI